jgi:hypothetical protein
MSARATDPVRLPARGSGYTTTNHRAITGVGAEVDPDILDGYAKAAQEQNTERDRQRRELVGKQAANTLGNANTLHALLKATSGIDSATRNRARRVVHDLQRIARELDIDGTGGPCKVPERLPRPAHGFQTACTGFRAI